MAVGGRATSRPNAREASRALVRAAARKLRRARSLSGRELADVARAAGWIAIVRIAVRLMPYPTLLERLTPRAGSGAARHPISRPTSPVSPAPIAEASATIARLARAVDIAAHNTWPRPTCLSRSLALWRMLAAEGVPAVVRLGVSRPGDGFEAHAWVEVGGLVVNDAPDVASRFRPLEHPPGERRP